MRLQSVAAAVVAKFIFTVPRWYRRRKLWRNSFFFSIFSIFHQSTIQCASRYPRHLPITIIHRRLYRTFPRCRLWLSFWSLVSVEFRALCNNLQSTRECKKKKTIVNYIRLHQRESDDFYDSADIIFRALYINTPSGKIIIYTVKVLIYPLSIAFIIRPWCVCHIVVDEHKSV